jgi:hypothetical protein
MFYFRKNKKSSFRSLDVKSKKEAIKVLKALYKDYFEYEILSELEYTNKDERISKSNKIWKSLSDKSKNICEELLSKRFEANCCSYDITEDLVKQFDLDNKSNKAYYAVVWDFEKHFGLFCDINDLNDLYYKQMNNYINGDKNDDVFITLYNSITLKQQKCDFSLMINFVEDEE